MGVDALVPDVFVYDGLIGDVWEAGLLSLAAGPMEARGQVLDVRGLG